MKIAITGAHSTGKSTLVAELQKDIKLSKQFEFRGNITRTIKGGNIKINELGTNETQLLVLSRHLDHYTPKNVILDRCALDGLVYTAYLFEKGVVNRETLRIAEAVFENLKYDIIFYIPPEFDIVDDKTRSTNPEFRNRIVELFEEYMDSYGIFPIRLTGSVKERVAQFKTALRSYKKHLKEINERRNISR